MRYVGLEDTLSPSVTTRGDGSPHAEASAAKTNDVRRAVERTMQASSSPRAHAYSIERVDDRHRSSAPAQHPPHDRLRLRHAEEERSAAVDQRKSGNRQRRR